MIILNKNYKSIYRNWMHDNFYLVRIVRNYLYPEQDERESFYYINGLKTPYTGKVAYRAYYPDYHGYGRQLLGAFQPVADMAKDFLDSFKPYKSTFQTKRDLKQPFWGVINALAGFASLFLIPLFYVLGISQVIFAKDLKHKRLSTFAKFSVLSVSWMLEGVLNMVRGLSQILTTPLTWAIKMPLRGILTKVKGAPKIEDNPGIQNLVEFGKTYLDTYKNNESPELEVSENLDARLISTSGQLKQIFDPDGCKLNDARIVDGVVAELHRKYHKSLQRGQPTNISEEVEGEMFAAQCYVVDDVFITPIREDRVRAGMQYLGLFSKDIQIREKSRNTPSVYTCGYGDDYNDTGSPRHDTPRPGFTSL